MDGFAGSRTLKGLSLAVLALAASHAWAQAPDGRALFEARCVACHELPDVAEAQANGLLESFDRMAKMARLRPNEQENVLEFIRAHTQTSAGAAALEEDRALFEQKCGHCHSLDRIFLQPLDSESLQHVVARMQARSGTDWLSGEDIERILQYLSNAKLEMPVPEPLAPDADGHDIFEARCIACHTLERVFAMPINGDAEEEWGHVISRMRGRAPEWMTESEAEKILDYLMSLPAPTEAP